MLRSMLKNNVDSCWCVETESLGPQEVSIDTPGPHPHGGAPGLKLTFWHLNHYVQIKVEMSRLLLQFWG